jgi:hypothetical protein
MLLQKANSSSDVNVTDNKESKRRSSWIGNSQSSRSVFSSFIVIYPLKSITLSLPPLSSAWQRLSRLCFVFVPPSYLSGVRDRLTGHGGYYLVAGSHFLTHPILRRRHYDKCDDGDLATMRRQPRHRQTDSSQDTST